MDSVGLHLIEWPFYPLYVFSYSLIKPVCKQKKIYRGDFFELDQHHLTNRCAEGV